jgi:hypothetical protein
MILGGAGGVVAPAPEEAQAVKNHKPVKIIPKNAILFIKILHIILTLYYTKSPAERISSQYSQR